MSEERNDEQLTLLDLDTKPIIKGFPELRWTGKRPYKQTQYYPAQLKERYGNPDANGWFNKIFWGDNLQVMSHLLKEYRGKIDLIYIDPPFDSKADYKKKIELKGKHAENDNNFFEQKQYGDIWNNDEYLQFMYERLILLRELLSDKGSIYVHLDNKRSFHLKLIMDEVFGSSNFEVLLFGIHLFHMLLVINGYHQTGFIHRQLSFTIQKAVILSSINYMMR